MSLSVDVNHTGVTFLIDVAIEISMLKRFQKIGATS